jgi:N-acyl-phosphatidylethanolamine-hydrolysing phospholipase D
MITITQLPPARPESYQPDHHIGSPPSSFNNPWPSFSTSGLSPLKIRFARDRPAFVPIPDRSELVQVQKPDWGGERPGFKATWIGHASFLLETSKAEGASRGVRILCDPVFSERTSPLSFVGPKRYRPTPCTLDELPDVDVVIISHSHYDHCDVGTLKHLHQKHKENIHFFAGLRNAVWFHSLGIPAAQVTELDWWDTVSIEISNIGSIKLTCTPTQHFSGRSLFDRNKTLWCSYVIEESELARTSAPSPKKVFFAGDTGYRSIPPSGPNSIQPLPDLDESTLPHCPVFSQIGQQFGPFDLALLPIGLCSPRVFMSPVHCNSADSLCLHRDLKSKKSVGMHWGTVRGGLSQEYEDVRDPPRRWKQEAEKEGLKWRRTGDGNDDWEIGLMDIGETVVLG